MIHNIVVISDTHCGCQFGLCPPKVKLDGGGNYEYSNFQKIVYNKWKEFWTKFVPEVTNNEDYVIIHNGDAIDGTHHGSTTQISHNITDQQNIYYEVFSQILKDPHCKQYYHIRGTEAHVGKSGEYEEKMAQQLGAKPDESGNYARWELWLKFAGGLGHFTHHIGTTSSAAYESTAVHKELVEAYNEAGRWKDVPPDFIIRSHRHRAYEIKIPSDRGFAHAIVTPGWQLKMLDLDTPLPTVNGWTTMRDVKIGDILFDENGKECNVISVGDINPNPKSYIVKFRNGEVVKACSEHLWLTIAEVDKPGVPGSRKKRPLKRVRTTEEIYKTLYYGKKKSLNHKIEMPLPLQTAKKELPIDPYVLGCWLGDGDSDGARMTINVKDIKHFRDEFNKIGCNLNKQKSKNRCGRFGIETNNKKCFKVVLRETNLLNNKHIPTIYLRSSFSQRLSLLQGLMDTDGNADMNGRACFFTTSKQSLSLGMNELLASLGIKFTVVKRPSILNGEKVGEHWLFRFFISPDIFPVFRMQRKMKRMPNSTERKTAQKSRTVQIVSIEPCKPVPMRCIAVNSESHLYRFGKTMLYTHNTPFVYRGTLGRTGTPQIGGIVIRHREDIPIYTRAKIWRLDRPKEEVI